MGYFVKKPIVFEAVYLNDNARTIEECTLFLNGWKPIDNDTSEVAREKWMDYLFLVREQGGIKIGDALVEFNRWIVKTGDNEYTTYIAEEFDAIFDEYDG
jgi:hypothetical protein